MDSQAHSIAALKQLLAAAESDSIVAAAFLYSGQFGFFGSLLVPEAAYVPA